MIEVLRYVTRSGRVVISDWLERLRDKQVQARIAVRFLRLAAGNFGDCRPLRDGVWEMRIDWGPGYRLYYAMAGRTCVLLLCGGDKRTQAADIERAIAYWRDYQQRTCRP
jgi:putative addiction module killer protein